MALFLAQAITGFLAVCGRAAHAVQWLIGAWLFYSLLAGSGVMPPWLHLAALLSLLTFTVHHICHLSWHSIRPGTQEIRRAIERASGIPHRWLSQPPVHAASGGDSRWWQVHINESHINLQHYRPAIGWLPWPAWQTQALRLTGASIIGLLIMAFTMPAALHPRNLFQPDIQLAGITTVPTYDVWIEPPAYTRQPIQQKLQHTGQAVPAGSTLHMTVYNSLFKPRLNGLETTVQETEGKYTLQGTLTADTTLSAYAGLRTLGHWPVTVTPDTAPTITFHEPPQATPQQALQIPLTASDDYGIHHIELLITATTGSHKPVVLEVYADPRSATETVTITRYFDLTSEHMAGEEVTLTLTARDAAGQQTSSAPATLILPERVFRNPTAQEIADIRRALLDGKSTPITLSHQLIRIVVQPSRLNHDITSYLALRSAYTRLKRAGDSALPEQAINQIANLLWQTALRLDQGTLPRAAADLRTAAEQLRQALQNPATSAAELQAHFAAYQKALQQYLGAAMAQVRDALPHMQRTTRDAIGLGDFLEKMQALADSGNRDKALEALEQLQQMMEQASFEPVDMEKLQAAAEAMAGIDAVITRQQQLTDTTYKSEPAKLSQLQQQQQTIQETLATISSNVMKAGLPPPPAFDAADTAMATSATALKDQEKQQALTAQQQALEALQQAMQQAEQQLQQQAGGMMFAMPMPYQPGQQEGEGSIRRENFRLPAEVEATRVQQILKTLRDRVNEQSRPAIERRYYQNLLDALAP